MKDQLKYFTAGVFIGISELLPGISGATVALMFGVYEKILNFLTKFRDLNLIIPIFVGMVLSVFLFSSLVNFLYTNFTQTFNIFIAFIMIGYGIFLLINTYLKENINKGKTFYLNVFLAIFIGFLLSGFYITGSYPPDGPFTPSVGALIIFGFFACTFLLFPGISGSAFLLAVGIYPYIIGSISNLNIDVLLPFAIGMLIALIVMPRIINKAYEKYGKSILIFFGGLIFSAGLLDLAEILNFLL